MATFTCRCPSCAAKTVVTTKDSGVILGSVPPLTVRFACDGCGIVLNATTGAEPIVWPDRPPKEDEAAATTGRALTGGAPFGETH